MIAQLRYDPFTDRYILNGDPLHAGDPLRVLIYDSGSDDFRWKETRIERNADDQWYLVGLSGIQMNGLWAE